MDIDVDEFLNNPGILPCHCALSEYRGHNHGHVITGDLNIVDNEQLKSLLAKGLKYSEPENKNWEELTDSFRKKIDSTITKWSNKCGISKTCFSAWKNTLMHLLMEKVNSIKQNC